MGDELVLYVGEKNISSWSMRAFVALHARVSSRHKYGPWARGGDLGFRCVAAPPVGL